MRSPVDPAPSTPLARPSRVAETERLVVRWFEPDDAPFGLALLNDPDWLRHIGDRGVRDLDGARIVAIVSQENPPSRRLLERLGFRREGTIRLPPGDEELLHYVSEA